MINMQLLILLCHEVRFFIALFIQVIKQCVKFIHSSTLHPISVLLTFIAHTNTAPEIQTYALSIRERQLLIKFYVLLEKLCLHWKISNSFWLIYILYVGLKHLQDNISWGHFGKVINRNFQNYWTELFIKFIKLKECI